MRFTCDACGARLGAADVAAHEEECMRTRAAHADVIDLTSSPPAKAARASAGDSPSKSVRATALAAPGAPPAAAAWPAPPLRLLATAACSPRRALAELPPGASPQRAPHVLKRESGPAAVQAAWPLPDDAADDDVICVDALPLRPPPRRPTAEARTPARAEPLLVDDDDEDEEEALPEVPWSHLRPARPPGAAAATPASTRKVKPEELWPLEDEGAGAAAFDSDDDAGDAEADAEAAERSLRGFGHLEDAPLDASLLVDVTTRLKPHQLIFAKWARDRPAVLLADEMGLGKTLSALALCRARMPPESWTGAGTLIVMPKSLLHQWEAEIKARLGGLARSGGVHIWYGPKREKNSDRLRRYEFVLTTYDAVRGALGASGLAEPGAGVWGDDDEDGDAGATAARGASPLATLRFWRVVLDEAHVARNRNTRLCAALSRLRTERRVALTGTPIHNGLDDLYSLLRWLQAATPAGAPSLHLDAPHTRGGEAAARRTWRTRIGKPLASARRPQARAVAFARLNAVLAELLIRRLKSDAIRGALLVSLPPIRYDDSVLDFTPDEAALYDTLWGDAVACFNRHLKKGDVLKNFILILVKLLRVRQCCAHPALVVLRRDACGACRRPLGAGGTSGELRIAPCGHTFCAECIEARLAGGGAKRGGRSGRGGRGGGRSGGSGGARKASLMAAVAGDSSEDEEVAAATTAGPKPRGSCVCPVPDCEELITSDDLAPYSRDADDDDALQLAPPAPALGPAAGGHERSTKIHALLAGLAALPKGTKSLVFSQWTSLLDLVVPFLRAARIDHVRLDGSMSLEERSAAVSRFRSDPACSVLLLSLQAGGVGLHLVEATHVWELDQWWNPMSHDQAQQRCHRLGQSAEVTVHRLVVRDSIEERVLALQARKRGLAQSTLTADLRALNKLDLEDLKLLFGDRKISSGGAAGGASGSKPAAAAPPQADG